MSKTKTPSRKGAPQKTRPTGGQPMEGVTAKAGTTHSRPRCPSVRPLGVCSHCEGRGQVAMPLPEYATLMVLRSNNRPLAAEDVLMRLQDDVSVNAINNRLKRLWLAGWATRFRSGKYWLYEAASPSGSPHGPRP